MALLVSAAVEQAVLPRWVYLVLDLVPVDFAVLLALVGSDLALEQTALPAVAVVADNRAVDLDSVLVTT